MTEQAPDDIFALYSRFDLDGGTYRVFPRAAAAAKTSATTLLLPELATPGLVAKDVAVENRHAAAVTLPLTLAPAPTAAITMSSTGQVPVTARESDGSRAALHNLWLHVKPTQPAHHTVTAASLAAGSISVYGAAGGVGTTTVAASLTRLLSKTGGRCAIFDQTGDCTLPIFFGAQKIAEDHRRFSGLHALFEPRIRILNREMFEPMDAEHADGSSFIERNFGAIAGDLDHLIFDHPARSAGDTGARVALCVAIPDLSSLAGSRKLIQRLEGGPAGVKAVGVLNRFEATSALHQEVLGWYRESFADVITIRQSPLFSEALAEGTTVLDWAPDAGVSTDLLELFALTRRLLAAGEVSVCS